MGDGASPDIVSPASNVTMLEAGTEGAPAGSADARPAFVHALEETAQAEVEPQIVAPRQAPMVQSVASDTRPAATAAAVDYALPMDSLVAVAESAGLQWVNSDADKIRSAHDAMAAMPPEIRVPREIHRPEPADEGALVLVETKKDLSQFKLPFELAGADAPKA